MKRSLILALVPLAMACAQQVRAADVPDAVEELLVQDSRLATISERLLASNASLCRQTMPLMGMVIHSRDQYPVDTAEQRFANGPIEVALVLPGSPAEHAGLKVGDGLVAIGNRRTADLRAEGDAPLRDSAFEALASEWPGNGPFTVTVRRGGVDQEITLQPATGCRALVEIRTRDSLKARSDGRVIQIDYGLAAAATDEQLAVIFAHELGHLVLEHRRRLNGAGVSKGFFGEFGRNRRLNRQVEVEADRITIHLLANAGLDPQIAPDFWRSSLARRAASGFNLTYPSNKARAELLEQEIADHLPAREGPTYPEHLLAQRDAPFAR